MSIMSIRMRLSLVRAIYERRFNAFVADEA